jgi:2-polyprenyl-3-methyl-5-hydroxy-6-metoxy-1,4-benzoquinol methylase
LSRPKRRDYWHSKEWSHEETYKGSSLSSVMHRRRLRALLDVYQTIPIPEGAAIADFGCSNAYLLVVLEREIFRGRVARIHGFDHAEHYVEAARERNIPNAVFEYFDLNDVGDAHEDEFDVVTCFETLEHVGFLDQAFENLYRVCKPGGTIAISVPNEKGVAGVLKYFGRRILRRGAYDDFFDTRSESRYVTSLLLNRPIHPYRQPPAEAWGPHLGFDWERLDGLVRREYVDAGKLEPARYTWSSLRFNVFMTYRKTPKGRP